MSTLDKSSYYIYIFKLTRLDLLNDRVGYAPWNVLVLKMVAHSITEVDFVCTEHVFLNPRQDITPKII